MLTNSSSLVPLFLKCKGFYLIISFEFISFYINTDILSLILALA